VYAFTRPYLIIFPLFFQENSSSIQFSADGFFPFPRSASDNSLSPNRLVHPSSDYGAPFPPPLPPPRFLFLFVTSGPMGLPPFFFFLDGTNFLDMWSLGKDGFPLLFELDFPPFPHGSCCVLFSSFGFQGVRLFFLARHFFHSRRMHPFSNGLFSSPGKHPIFQSLSRGPPFFPSDPGPPGMESTLETPRKKGLLFFSLLLRSVFPQIFPMGTFSRQRFVLFFL